MQLRNSTWILEPVEITSSLEALLPAHRIGELGLSPKVVGRIAGWLDNSSGYPPGEYEGYYYDGILWVMQFTDLNGSVGYCNARRHTHTFCAPLNLLNTANLAMLSKFRGANNVSGRPQILIVIHLQVSNAKYEQVPNFFRLY